MSEEIVEPTILQLARIAYGAYGEATNFKNFRGEPMPIWEELPDEIQKAWCHSALVIHMQPRDTSPPRCRWLVQAGNEAGVTLPRHTRHFQMSHDEFAQPNNNEIYHKRLDTALAYARSLSDPNLVNWVELKLIWH